MLECDSRPEEGVDQGHGAPPSTLSPKNKQFSGAGEAGHDGLEGITPDMIFLWEREQQEDDLRKYIP